MMHIIGKSGGAKDSSKCRGTHTQLGD